MMAVKVVCSVRFAKYSINKNKEKHSLKYVVDAPDKSLVSMGFFMLKKAYGSS